MKEFNSFYTTISQVMEDLHNSSERIHNRQEVFLKELDKLLEQVLEDYDIKGSTYALLQTVKMMVFMEQMRHGTMGEILHMDGAQVENAKKLIKAFADVNTGLQVDPDQLN